MENDVYSQLSTDKIPDHRQPALLGLEWLRMNSSHICKSWSKIKERLQKIIWENFETEDDKFQ